MAYSPRFELTMDQQALANLTRRVRAEANGKHLRKELLANLKAAALPAAQAVRDEVSNIPGPATGRPPLGPAIAARVQVQVRLSGRTPGVRIRIPKRKGFPRGFINAPLRLNRRRGWRHPLFGDRNHWVQQIGKPGYFDDTLNARKDEFRAAVVAAMNDMARRITR